MANDRDLGSFTQDPAECRNADDYQPRQTSKLFAADGRFIAELGLERRTLLKLDQIPPMVRSAFVDFPGVSGVPRHVELKMNQ